MEKVVILDPGHGGIDPISKEYVTKGKRSPEWDDMPIYYEGVGNRQIVKLASQLLRPLGWNVLYTVHPDDSRDIPLSNRVNKCNDFYKTHPEAFLVSVHSNGFIKESAKGYEVFTSPGETKSDKMATIFMQEFPKLFPNLNRRVDTSDGDLDKEAKFTMIHKTKCPAILIESMFHTNYEECKILHTREGKEKIAIAITETCERIHNEIIK